MELGMSLNPLIRLPMNSNLRTKRLKDYGKPLQFVVDTKGKNEMLARRFQRSAHPPLPKIENNRNPFFVSTIRKANLPTRDQLKLVVVKVKDIFGEAKESVGKLITLDTSSSKEVEGTSVEKSKNTQKAKQEGIIISRRVGATVGMSSLCLTTEAVMNRKAANSFEFRMTVPDQTAEEAQSMIRDHAQALLDVKSLLESESWREAQRELRQNSAYLKQDIYTIIQSKEGSVRPLLRKLYSNLFNNVTKLDYAARDRDVERVEEFYNNVATVLNDILSRI